MKDFKQYCDEVAKKQGNTPNVLAGSFKFPLFEEAAQLYAKEVALEAVKLAREINVPTGGGIIIQVGKYTEQEILEKLKL